MRIDKEGSRGLRRYHGREGCSTKRSLRLPRTVAVERGPRSPRNERRKAGEWNGESERLGRAVLFYFEWKGSRWT